MSEERLQSEVIKYIKYQYPQIRYCGSAGGVYTGITQARKMVRTGYVKGFPDLFIYEARTINGKVYHGLAIEIKTIKGRATKEQKEWIDDLNERGYKAKICKGLPEILDVIDKYLNEKD
jgi:hypothetical protein